MDRLALTGAELTFLLSLGEEARGQRARERLRLPDGGDGEAMMWDGLSSLAVRGLAYGAGTEVVLAPPVAAVQEGLARPTLWVEISALTRDLANAAHLYVHGRGMFLLSPRAFGAFELQGVRSGVSPVELLVSVARRFLADRQPALVVCRGESAGASFSMGLGRLADGSYLVSGDATTSERPAATLDDALGEFGARLSSLPTELSTVDRSTN